MLKEKINNNRKAKIIIEAIKVFAKDGFDKASMDAVALKAKVAKGTIFYHYKTKKGLFDAIIAEGEKSLTELILKRTEGLISSTDKIKIVIKTEREFIEKYKELFKILVEDILTKNKSFKPIEDIILEGMANNEFRRDISAHTQAVSIFWLTAMTALNGEKDGQENILLEGIKK